MLEPTPQSCLQSQVPDPRLGSVQVPVPVVFAAVPSLLLKVPANVAPVDVLVLLTPAGVSEPSTSNGVPVVGKVGTPEPVSVSKVIVIDTVPNTRLTPLTTPL